MGPIDPFAAIDDFDKYITASGRSPCADCVAPVAMNLGTVVTVDSLLGAVSRRDVLDLQQSLRRAYSTMDQAGPSMRLLTLLIEPLLAFVASLIPGVGLETNVPLRGFGAAGVCDYALTAGSLVIPVTVVYPDPGHIDAGVGRNVVMQTSAREMLAIGSSVAKGCGEDYREEFLMQDAVLKRVKQAGPSLGLVCSGVGTILVTCTTDAETGEVTVSKTEELNLNLYDDAPDRSFDEPDVETLLCTVVRAVSAQVEAWRAAGVCLNGESTSTASTGSVDCA